ncbi:MAG: VCBS repeat-containing protein [Umezawaea sp.]
MRSTAALLLALAASATFAVPASAAVQATAQADLDGDGVLDTVTAEPIAGTQDEQLLTATIRGLRLTARVPLASHVGIQPLRVVDLNGDGTDEVVVTESVGANTLGFSAWGFYGGLRPVTEPGGSVLRLWEGGGLSAIDAYGCLPAGDARALVTVEATLTDWPNGVYTGTRITSSLAVGVATERARTAVGGPRDAPGFQVDPADCA